MSKTVSKGIVSGFITSGLFSGGAALAVGALTAFFGGPVLWLATCGAAFGGLFGSIMALLNAETNERGHHAGAALRAGLATTVAASALMAATPVGRGLVNLVTPAQDSVAREFNLQCTQGRAPSVEKTGDVYTVRIPAACRKIA